MASNLRVDTILPSTGTNVAIGTASGSVTFLGDTDITTSGSVSIGGTLTYEDVTNIDSVGVITARSGIRIAAGSTVGPVSGIITYFGDGSQLTGISVDSSSIKNGSDVKVQANSHGAVVTGILTVTGNASISGIVTFGSGVSIGYDTTYSPIQQSANTWWYTRFDQSASVSGSTIVNLATGPIKILSLIHI